MAYDLLFSNRMESGEDSNAKHQTRPVTFDQDVLRQHMHLPHLGRAKSRIATVHEVSNQIGQRIPRHEWILPKDLSAQRDWENQEKPAQPTPPQMSDLAPRGWCRRHRGTG